jgi:hypothetical protein
VLLLPLLVLPLPMLLMVLPLLLLMVLPLLLLLVLTLPLLLPLSCINSFLLSRCHTCSCMESGVTCCFEVNLLLLVLVV